MIKIFGFDLSHKIKNQFQETSSMSDKTFPMSENEEASSNYHYVYLYIKDEVFKNLDSNVLAELREIFKKNHFDCGETRDSGFNIISGNISEIHMDNILGFLNPEHLFNKMKKLLTEVLEKHGVTSFYIYPFIKEQDEEIFLLSYTNANLFIPKNVESKELLIQITNFFVANHFQDVKEKTKNDNIIITGTIDSELPKELFKISESWRKNNFDKLKKSLEEFLSEKGISHFFY